MEKTWQANETQKDFMKVLENYPDGASLKDIELDTGKVFKTGSINVLIGKGMVEVVDGEFAVNLVYRDKVIGQVKKPWKIYRLVKYGRRTVGQVPTLHQREHRRTPFLLTTVFCLMEYPYLLMRIDGILKQVLSIIIKNDIIYIVKGKESL